MSNATIRAYDFIKAAIMSDTFKAGSRIKEEIVAEKVGVSRTPIREALRRLAAEGFVTMLPNQGVRVNEWSADDLAEIVDLRAELEGFGAGIAAQKITPEQLSELETLCDQMEQAALDRSDKSFEALTELNSLFHLAIINASGNRRLAEVISNLAHPLLVQRRFSAFDETRLQRSFNHHRELLDALRAKDPGWATAVMRSHILASRSVKDLK